MKKEIIFLLLLSLFTASYSLKTKVRVKTRVRRRVIKTDDNDKPADTPKDSGKIDTAMPENIKIDRTALMIPKIPITLQKQPQLVVERKIIHKSQENPDELKAEEPCQLKQGYLLKEISMENTPTPIVHAIPAFTVLNKKSISFFDGENVHALISSYPLGNLVVDDSNYLWTQINCFQLFKGKAEPENLLSVVCAENPQEKDEWVKAIREYCACQLKVYDTTEITQTEMKTKKLRLKMESDEELEERRLKEKEDNDEEMTQLMASSADAQKLQLEGISQQIIQEFQKQREIEETKKQQLLDEKKKMMEKTKKYGAQARCIENALEVKALEEEKSMEVMLAEEKSMKEKNLMSDAYTKLRALWKSESEGLDQQRADVIKATKEIQTKIKRTVITEATDWTKLLDPSECYADNMTGGNLRAMKDVCATLVDYGKAPDVKMLLRCLNKQYFCDECCSYYIGVAHEKDKIKCMERCNQVINSPANVYFISYGPKKASK